MGVRMTEAAVAVGFGAADAFVTAKVSGAAPGGIPWPVVLEGVGLLGGLFGDKVGLGADVHQPLFFAAASLAGARLTRAAVSGKLMSGPKAWGGVGVVGNADPMYTLSAGAADMPPGSLGGGAGSVRLLAGRAIGGRARGGASVYPAMSETAGVAG